jgi:hypothetical protein
MTHSSGGDGSAFRPEIGTHPGLLAEVLDKGHQIYNQASKSWSVVTQGDKGAKHKALAIFVLPTQICGDDAPDDRKGTPKLAFLDVRNLSFSDSPEPEWQTVFQHYLSGWFGKVVPPDKWEAFCFGREYGSGPGQLKRGLKPKERQAQAKALPGVPVGTAVLVTIEHDNSGADGKIWARIGPPRPPSPPQDSVELQHYLEVMKNWKPGLSPADAEAKLYTFDDDMNLLKGGESYPEAMGYAYPGWEAIRSSGSGSSSPAEGQQPAESSGDFADEPEDGDEDLW